MSSRAVENTSHLIRAASTAPVGNSLFTNVSPVVSASVFKEAVAPVMSNSDYGSTSAFANTFDPVADRSTIPVPGLHDPCNATIAELGQSGEPFDDVVDVDDVFTFPCLFTSTAESDSHPSIDSNEDEDLMNLVNDSEQLIADAQARTTLSTVASPTIHPQDMLFSFGADAVSTFNTSLFRGHGRGAEDLEEIDDQAQQLLNLLDDQEDGNAL